MNEQQLAAWFDNLRDVLQEAYLAQVEPWRQSGMSGPYERWESLRKPVADCLDRDGAFLDIGCANGYLLECIVRWTAERDLKIIPYGLDISARLAALARQRLPDYAANIFTGNAFDWIPPRRFDFVRTELVYVPAELEKTYLDRLLANFLVPGGKLLVANYIEGLEHPERGILPGSYPARWIEERLAELGFSAEAHCDGYDPIKDRRVRVAVLTAPP